MNKMPNDKSKKTGEPKQPKQQKPAPPPEPIEPPEDSVPLRIVTFLMTVICIGSGCYFVDTPFLMTALYLLFAFGGCYLSYQYRHEHSKWLHVFVTIGMVAVAVNAGHELFTGCGTGRFQLFAPIVHFVAGTFIMHSFEAKTRSDINMSSALGLLLLCLMAPVGKSFLYGACVLGYIMLGAIMLYFDCISRTMQSWLPKPMAPAPIEELSQRKGRRAGGNTFVAVALLPALTVALFLFIPRFDNIIDVVMANIQKLTNKQPQPTPNEGMPSPDGPEQRRRFEHKNKDKAKKEDKDKKNVTLEADKQEPPEKKDDPKSKKDKKVEDKNDKQKDPKDPKAKPEEGKKEDEQKSDDTSKQQKNKDDKESKEGKGDGKGTPEESGPGTEGSGKGEKGKGKGKVGDPSSDTDQVPLIMDEDLDVQKLLFTVNCRRTLFFRLTALDKFDGETWHHSLKKAQPKVYTIENDNNQGFYILKDAPSLEAQADSISVSQDFVVEEDLSKNIPAAPIPQKITNNGDGWRWKKLTVDSYGTLHTDEIIKAKTKYQVESAVALYDLKALRKEPNIGMKLEDQLRAELEPYLQIPDNQSLDLFTIAEKQAKEGNWFNQAENILWYMRKNYKYSLSGPVSGTSNVVETFLSEKAGNCRCFATTFVLMTRAVGIPSRLVAGYAPGEFNKLSGLREVRVKDSHTWAEVYIPRHGWIPFDPVPNGTLPDKPKELSYDFGSLSKKGGLVGGGGAFDQPQVEEISPFRWVLIGVAIVLSLILCFFLFRAIKRMIAAWRAQYASVHPAARILRKLLQDLSFLGIKRSKGDTATDLALKINEALKERSEEGKPVDPAVFKMVDSFMESYSAVHFGNRKYVDELKRQADDITYRARKKN